MQGRFGATIVDEDEYILKLSRYVHLNPVYIKKVQALPIRERIELLRHYPWSSYRSYIGRCPPLSFVDYAPILEMMGRPKKKQASMYRRFVETGISDMDAAFIDAKKQSRLCIGSDSSNDRGRPALMIGGDRGDRGDRETGRPGVRPGKRKYNLTSPF